MNILISANFIALIASSLAILVGPIKNRNKIIIIQIIQSFLFSISNFLLGGFSGFFSNLIDIIRNILCYKNKLTKDIIILIIFLLFICTLKFNNLGLIGFLPFLATLVYTIFINQKNPIKFKLLVASTVLLWVIHDLFIRSYTSAIFNSFNCLLSLITAYNLSIQKQKH